MGRIVAISGGDLESTAPINRYAIKMTGKDNPHVLFIPTASRDDDNYILDFHKTYENMGCSVRSLTLVKREYTKKEIQQFMDWAELIYVGGGNAVFMLRMWKAYGLDKKLREVFDSDSAVLTGSGAGCACWFSCGYSNSEYVGGGTDWQYVWADELLDMHHTAVCPHYNEEGRKGFDSRLMEKGIPGFALEDNTAFVQIQDRTEFIKSTEDARAYYLIYMGGELKKREIDTKLVK